MSDVAGMAWHPGFASVASIPAVEERIGVPRLGGAFELVDRPFGTCFPDHPIHHCLLIRGQERQDCDRQRLLGSVRSGNAAKAISKASTGLRDHGAFDAITWCRQFGESLPSLVQVPADLLRVYVLS